MTIEQLEQRIGQCDSTRALEQHLATDRTIRLKGMAGSLLALVAGSVARRTGGVLPDAI